MIQVRQAISQKPPGLRSGIEMSVWRMAIIDSRQDQDSNPGRRKERVAKTSATGLFRKSSSINDAMNRSYVRGSHGAILSL